MTLNENPILSRQKILQTRMNSDKIPEKDLDDHLEAQIELVKITPEPLSLEDITKLWSSFFQTHYRLSVSYLITVVLLDSNKKTKISPPVQERNLYVFPLGKPAIERIDPQIVESGPQANITIWGQNLMAENVEIFFGNVIATPDVKDVFSDRITISLPSQLESGIKSVLVAHPLAIGEPPIKHGNWNTSNVAAFVLSPRITDPSEIKKAARGSSFALTVEPAVTHKQKVSVLIGQHQFDIKLPKPDEVVYPINVLPDITIPKDFPLEVSPQKFLIRVRIDDAESLVKFDNDPSSSTFEEYVPAIEVTE
jgi:Pvc16 N-terminal domain